MDRKLKHLDFIQGVINRLSTNSFLLKGWSVILISALFAMSAQDSRVAFVYLSYIPAIVFWGLDGYFLALERAYRDLYNITIDKKPDDIDFKMNISKNGTGFSDWFSATFSVTVAVFHLSLIFSIAVVMSIHTWG